MRLVVRRLSSDLSVQTSELASIHDERSPARLGDRHRTQQRHQGERASSNTSASTRDSMTSSDASVIVVRSRSEIATSS